MTDTIVECILQIQKTTVLFDCLEIIHHTMIVNTCHDKLMMRMLMLTNVMKLYVSRDEVR